MTKDLGDFRTDEIAFIFDTNSNPLFTGLCSSRICFKQNTGGSISSSLVTTREVGDSNLSKKRQGGVATVHNSSLHPALLVLVLMSVSKVHLYSQSTACQLAVEAFSFSFAVAACNTVYVGSTQFDRALASLQIKLENQYWVCSSLDSMRWKLPAMRKRTQEPIKSQALLHPGGLPGCIARSTLHGSSQQKLELDDFLTKLLFSPAFHIMISLCIFDKNVQQQDPMCNCLPLMNVICYTGITHTRKESRPSPKISKPGRTFFDRGRPPSSWTVGLEMWKHTWRQLCFEVNEIFGNCEFHSNLITELEKREAYP